MRSLKLLLGLIIVLVIFVSFGCENGRYHIGKGWVTSINVVKENPEEFREKKSATIKGTVMENITVAGYSGYKLKGKTEDIVVIGKASPAKGEDIYVVGHSEKLIGVGSFAVEVFVMDE